MHRSGTSLTAALVDAVGVSMGENLLAADRNNQRGYFEDVDFLAFHRKVLSESVPAGEEGVPDWGWTVSETLNTSHFQNYRPEAGELIRKRLEGGGTWGWKDPRTTLMLDFWNELLPDARFLFVYRPPWEVADSMMRVGGDYFPRHPDATLQIWSWYNEHLLRFFKAHRERCLLLNVTTLLSDPERLVPLLVERFGIEVPDAADAAARLASVCSRELFHPIPATDPMVELLRHLSPRPFRVLEQLEEMADCAGDESDGARKALSPEQLPALPFFLHTERTALRSELAQTRRELQEASDQLWHTRKELESARGELEFTRGELARVGEELMRERWNLGQALREKENQVASLWELNQQYQQQNGELRQELAEVWSRLDQCRWEANELSGVIESMRRTRVWRLREVVMKIRKRP